MRLDENMMDKPRRPTFEATFFSVYGFVGLVLSAFIHVGSFGRMVVPSDSGVFMLMHMGIFPLFFAYVSRARDWHEHGNERLRVYNPLPSRELLAFFPWWASALVVALFAYACINFVLATGLGTGAFSVEALTDAQDARAFSGHWMFFYALPAVYFGFVPAEPGSSSTHHAAE